MSAAILHGKKGDRYPLWTSRAAGESINLPATKYDNGFQDSLKALSFLTEIRIETQLAQIARITARLEPPYLDAIRFMDSELIEFGINRLQVQFGYARGGASGGPVFSDPPFEGMMLRPEVSFGSDISITLTAQGTNGNVISQLPGGGRTFNMKRREIIITLASYNNDEVDFSLADEEAEVKRRLDEETSVVQAWRTNEYLIHQLLSQCFCAGVRLGKTDDGRGKVIVKPRANVAKEQPEVTLAMYHLPRGVLGGTVYPIINASSPTGALFLPGVRTLIMREIDSKSRTLKQDKTDDERVKAAQTNPGPGNAQGDRSNVPAPDEEKVEGFQPHPGDPASDEFKAQAASIFQAQKNAMGFPLDVETLGAPTITPGQVVAVRGLGQRLSTNYAVIKVVHTLNASGFSTNLSLIANAASVVNAQLAVESSGKSNTTEPSENGGQNMTRQPK